MSETTNNLIEAFLFWKNEPVSLKKLTSVFSITLDELKKEIDTLRQKLSTGGIVLIEKDDEVMLGVSGEASELIEKMTKEELSKELSKAALETLSIILYKSPVKRSEIDYIRGVNSQFILRNLEIRGLIEKKQSDDGRANIYLPAFELLAHLGIKNIAELPEFDVLRKEVEVFESVANLNQDDVIQ